jgi:antitoxin ParD1/3/4
MPSTLNISLPTPLKRWVEEQVEAKGYGTASEFIGELVRQKLRAQEAHATVESKLIAAINSGRSTPMTKKDWEKIKRDGLKKLRTAQSKRA